jgi:hypothetical protein
MSNRSKCIARLVILTNVKGAFTIFVGKSKIKLNQEVGVNTTRYYKIKDIYAVKEYFVQDEN